MRMNLVMGRPPTGKPWKNQVTARFDPKLIEEIDGIADALFAKRTSILEEIIELGLGEFKKKNPDLMEAVRKRKESPPRRLEPTPESFHERSETEKPKKRGTTGR